MTVHMFIFRCWENCVCVPCKIYWVGQNQIYTRCTHGNLSTFIFLANSMYTQCIYGIAGREITKYTYNHIRCTCTFLANSMYIRYCWRCCWQGNHQMYGHIRYTYIHTNLADHKHSYIWLWPTFERNMVTSCHQTSQIANQCAFAVWIDRVLNFHPSLAFFMPLWVPTLLH